jgi:methionine sulfoxide reductase heme-binding subunit
MPLLWFRLVVPLIGLAPLFWIGWLYQQDELGIFPEETLLHITGHSGLMLLLLTISWGMLRRFTGWVGFIATRRQLGLWAFWWLLAHACIWAGWDQGWNFDWIWREMSEMLHLQLGLTALLVLLLLAVTSPTRIRLAMQGLIWQSLHRLVYVATALGVWHLWIITRLDYRLVMAYALLLASLLLLRLVFLRPPTPR